MNMHKDSSNSQNYHLNQIKLFRIQHHTKIHVPSKYLHISKHNTYGSRPRPKTTTIKIDMDNILSCGYTFSDHKSSISGNIPLLNIKRIRIKCNNYASKSTSGNMQKYIFITINYTDKNPFHSKATKAILSFLTSQP